MTNKKTTEPAHPAKTPPKPEVKAADSPTKKTMTAKPNAPSTSRAEAEKPATDASTKPAATEKSGGGSGLLWTLLLFVVLGGAVTVGWPLLSPYAGDTARPLIEDMRTRLGLTPRPTQVQMPNGGLVTAPPVEVAVVPQTKPEAQVDLAPSPEVQPEVAVTPELAVDSVPQAINEPIAEPPLAGMTEDTPAVQTLVSRLDVLESQLAASSMADGQAALAQTSELAQLLSDLKSEMGSLNTRLDAMDATLQDLSSRQSLQTGASVSAQALVLAATQLRVRLLGDSSFTAELTALERIAGEDSVVLAAVGHLRPHAEVGVPSKADLTARFTSVAADIIRASATSGEAGWMATLKDTVSGLVTVRRTDPTEITNAVERSVAVAEAALQAGALDEAVQALSALQAGPGEAAAAWLGDARARVDVEAALEALYNQALAVMAQVGGA